VLLIIFSLKAPKAMTGGRRRCADFVSLGAVCAASICFWFLTSPDPRFLVLTSVHQEALLTYCGAIRAGRRRVRGCPKRCERANQRTSDLPCCGHN
jgi:hypothetical protein